VVVDTHPTTPPSPPDQRRPRRHRPALHPRSGHPAWVGNRGTPPNPEPVGDSVDETMPVCPADLPNGLSVVAMRPPTSTSTT